MEEKTHEEKILEELTTTEVHNHWYTKWWGIVLIIIGALIVTVGVLFAYQVQYYVDAYRSGNTSAFEGVFVDASNYSKYGNQVSRVEVETPDDPFWGPEDAELVIVEFADFECPFCKKNIPALTQLRNEYSDRVKFIYRDFPLTYTHPYALIAAQSSECADDQGAFWPMHDLLFQRQDQYSSEEDLVGYAKELGLDNQIFSECLSGGRYESEARNDFQEGLRFEVKGTPTFFINGVRLSGVVTYETFKEVIDRFLERL